MKQLVIKNFRERGWDVTDYLTFNSLRGELCMRDVDVFFDFFQFPSPEVVAGLRAISTSRDSRIWALEKFPHMKPLEAVTPEECADFLDRLHSATELLAMNPVPVSQPPCHDFDVSLTFCAQASIIEKDFGYGGDWVHAKMLQFFSALPSWKVLYRSRVRYDTTFRHMGTVFIITPDYYVFPLIRVIAKIETHLGRTYVDFQSSKATLSERELVDFFQKIKSRAIELIQVSHHLYFHFSIKCNACLSQWTKGAAAETGGAAALEVSAPMAEQATAMADA